MESTRTGETLESFETYRWTFVFSIDGDLRFISHRDTLRLFRRALVRAKVPLRYSEGFNPHPRITIPLPRPVGIASEAETITVETERPVDPEAALSRLEQHTPADIRMLSVRRLAVGERLVPRLVKYRLALVEPPPADLESRIRHLLNSNEIKVERRNSTGGKRRLINVRPYLVDLRSNDHAVELTLRVTGTGSARPAEIAGLLGYDGGTINHRIRRTEVRWQ